MFRVSRFFVSGPVPVLRVGFVVWKSIGKVWGSIINIIIVTFILAL